MAEPEDTRPESQQEHQEPAGGGLMKKLFARKGEDGDQEAAPRETSAQIPSTVLTVEYIDESEGMDASLREMQRRVQRMEEMLGNMQETQSQLIAAINQQAKDIGRFVESIGRRVDKLYRRMTGGEVSHHGALMETQAGGTDKPPTELRIDEDAATTLGPEVADDPRHQNAWRIARVLAADLEAYHEDAVQEGVLYGTFYKLLRDPLERARSTYEERVDDEIVENYDYFSKAVDELIARKRVELDQEGAT